MAASISGALTPADVVPAALLRVLSPLAVPCLLVRPSGAILASNAAARRLLGPTANSGGDLRDLSADAAAVRSYLAACSRTNSPIPGALVRPDGSRIRCDGAVVEPGAHPILLLRLTDGSTAASEFHALNERIEALHREVRQRRKAEDRLQHQATELEDLAAELEQTVEALQQQSEEAVRAREDARAAAARLATLADAGAVLAEPEGQVGTLQRLAEAAVRTSADACICYLRESDGSVRRVGGAHADPAMRVLMDKLTGTEATVAAPDSPLGRVLSEGDPALVAEVDEDMLRRWADSDAHFRLLHRLAPASVMLAPLRSKEGVFGALSLLRTARLPAYTEDDLRVAQELARRAALSLDNARLFDEAQRANTAKSEFLATMSHELRTPLNAVVGYADLLDAGVAGTLNDGQRSQVNRIRAAADHLSGIIEEILLFARVDAGRERVAIESVSLAGLLTGVVDLMRPAAEARGLELRVQYAGERTLLTDGSQLRQILLNLMSNAVKFTRSGGITVEVEEEDAEVRIMVTDTGAGIAPEHLASIFEPFWQVERGPTREAGGTGLGLTVTQRLAALLGGHISVSSVPGAGSTFTVVLPADPPSA
jgi:signal transduction histidine kinase